MYKHHFKKTWCCILSVLKYWVVKSSKHVCALHKKGQNILRNRICESNQKNYPIALTLPNEIYITKRRFSLPVLLYRKLTREKSHFIRKRAFVKKCCEKFRFFGNFWKNTEHKNEQYRYKQHRFWRNEIFGSSIWSTETPVGQVSSFNDRSLSEKLIKRKLEKIESSFLSRSSLIFRYIFDLYVCNCSKSKI